jgi:predicted alpha/beta-fold hydrolase
MTKFKPAIGLKNRHAQTLYSDLFRKQTQPTTQSEMFELNDGDFVECCWCANPPTDRRDIVILFHGLEGSYKSHYIQGVMNSLSYAGLSCVLMHFRGCSGKQNRLARAYHSGDTQDAKAWIEDLSKRFPNNKLHAVGYSLGANMLLKLLGEYKNKSPLTCAVCVSAPMRLDISANTINKGFSKLYQKHLLKRLKNTLYKKYVNHPMQDLINLKKEDIKKIKTFWEFDDVYTAKIHGFPSAKEYYERSSAKQYIKEIQTKTLIIHSRDDPFMTKDVLPAQSEISKSITLEVYKYGGHIGFISGSILSPVYWLENRILEYIKS